MRSWAVRLGSLPLLVGAAAIGCGGAPASNSVDALPDAVFSFDLGGPPRDAPPLPVPDGAWDLPWEQRCEMNCGAAEIARDGDSCRYLIHCPVEEGDFTRLGVTANGSAVPRDRSRSQGWDTTDASNAAIELYGAICDGVMNGTVADVTVLILCTTP